MRTFSILPILTAALLLTGCQTVSIKKPGADVPAEYAVFSGTWSGAWGKEGNLYGQLAVQEVMPTGLITGWYSWGNLPGSFSGGAVPVEGTIRDGVLRLQTFSNGANASYRLIDENTLEGTYSLSGRDTKGVFHREK